MASSPGLAVSDAALRPPPDSAPPLDLDGEPNPFDMHVAPALENSMALPEDDLRPPAARMLRLGALHEGPHLSVGVIASAAGLEPGQAMCYLDWIVRADLLIRDGDCYRYPTEVGDRARYYCRTLMPPDECEQAQARMAEAFYVEAMPYDYSLIRNRQRFGPGTRIYKYPDPAPHSRSDALAHLDRERPNLVAAQIAALRIDRQDLVLWLAEVLWAHSYLQRADVQSWIEVTRRGVDAAVACRDLAAEGRLRCMLAHPLLVAGEHGQASAHAAQALTLSQTLGDPVLRASALSGLGDDAHDRGDFSAAAAYYLDAALADEEANHPHELALHSCDAGEALSKLGRHQSAVRILLSALKRMTAYGSVVDAAVCRTELGLALVRAGRWKQADHALSDALRELEGSGHRSYLAAVWLAQAELARRRKHTAHAQQLAEQAYEIVSAGWDHRAKARAQQLLAELTA